MLETLNGATTNDRSEKMPNENPSITSHLFYHNNFFFLNHAKWVNETGYLASIASPKAPNRRGSGLLFVRWSHLALNCTTITSSWVRPSTQGCKVTLIRDFLKSVDSDSEAQQTRYFGSGMSVPLFGRFGTSVPVTAAALSRNLIEFA